MAASSASTSDDVELAREEVEGRVGRLGWAPEELPRLCLCREDLGLLDFGIWEMEGTGVDWRLGVHEKQGLPV